MKEAIRKGLVGLGMVAAAACMVGGLTNVGRLPDQAFAVGFVGAIALGAMWVQSSWRNVLLIPAAYLWLGTTPGTLPAVGFELAVDILVIWACIDALFGSFGAMRQAIRQELAAR